MALALDALRQDIQQQAPPAPQESKRPEQADQETASNDDDNEAGVPEIVSATLNNLPQPLVLVDQSGHLLFANDVAVELMAVENWQAIDKITTLGDALAALEGEDGYISLFTAKDEAISLVVIGSEESSDGKEGRIGFRSRWVPKPTKKRNSRSKERDKIKT